MPETFPFQPPRDPKPEELASGANKAKHKERIQVSDHIKTTKTSGRETSLGKPHGELRLPEGLVGFGMKKIEKVRKEWNPKPKMDGLLLF